MSRKPYPIDSDEQDAIYARKWLLCFSRSGIAKKIKRKMNKRFRKQTKLYIKNYEESND